MRIDASTAAAQTAKTAQTTRAHHGGHHHHAKGAATPTDPGPATTVSLSKAAIAASKAGGDAAKGDPDGDGK